MIRVLHVLGGLDRGGAETMVMNLYRAIDRTKVQFDFVIHTSSHQAYYPEIVEMGGRIYTFPMFNGINFAELQKIWNQFFVEHPEYRILHSHVRSYASLYIPIAKKYGVKTIIHSHSTSNGSGIKSCIKRLMQLPLRYQADYFFGCSKEAGEWLFGKKVVNGEKYHMLQNAIDIKKYSFNNSTRKQYRKELNVGNDITVFMHVGRLHEAKNHRFLVEVFARYHSVHPDSMLVLVGDGELIQEIKAKIDNLNITEQVKMLGSRNDVSNLLQAADCFLFPSKWEGLPVTVVEAQVSGLPCLVSDTVTKDVNVSNLVKSLPIDQGIDTWIRAIENTDFARKDVTQEIIEAGFDIQSSAEWMENFYRGLVNE